MTSSSVNSAAKRQNKSVYASELKAHLARYKADPHWGLGVEADGECLHRAYPHILPAAQLELNILPTIRDNFWEYWRTHQSRPAEDGKPPRLHRCFPHLNSSQALAFNLFYPFIKNDFADADLMLSALGYGKDDRVKKILFEYEPDKEEGSNFDVAIFLGSRRILVEVKLTEMEFGRCVGDKEHKDKRTRHYESDLRGKVSDSCVASDSFFENYQILRHFAQLKGDEVEVRFLFPKANDSLASGRDFIEKALLAPFTDHARTVYLEDFVESILRASADRQELNEHFQHVSRKYLRAFRTPTPSQAPEA
jgi:hypothetical protein